MPKKLTDSGTQPLETMTLAEGWPELTAEFQGLARIDHRFGNEGDFGRLAIQPSRSSSFAGSIPEPR